MDFMKVEERIKKMNLPPALQNITNKELAKWQALQEKYGEHVTTMTIMLQVIGNIGGPHCIALAVELAKIAHEYSKDDLPQQLAKCLIDELRMTLKERS